MDKALVFGTKDCRFESCQGHVYSLCMPLPTKLHSTIPRGGKTENPHGPQILKQRAWLFSACLSQRTRSGQPGVGARCRQGTGPLQGLLCSFAMLARILIILEGPVA